MKVGLMIEGQNGLTWERWSHILALAERLGFPTVFRSDHFFIGGEQDSLEAYLSFVMAAQQTSAIRFGPLVTPVTFRAPVHVGRMAAQIDVLSGGRFTLGLGAGWNEAEHRAYGIPFPPVKERFDRLENAIVLIKAMWGQGPATVDGTFYELAEADPMPKPAPGRPPILIGGSGEQRTLRIAAEHAVEWNMGSAPPETYAHKVEVLERHCEDIGRDPATIRRSIMTFGAVGPDRKAVEFAMDRLGRMFPAAASGSYNDRLAAAREKGTIAGTTEEVVDQLGKLGELGLDEVIFQHYDFDNDDVPEYLASEVVPQVAGL